MRLEIADSGGDTYRSRSSASSTTGGDGRFQIFVRPPEGRARLVTRRRGYLTRPIDLSSGGGQGLEITLQEGEAERNYGNSPFDPGIPD